MAKLIFLLDGNVINEYALDKERMTIGRRASNDIHIDNLAISGEHAAISVEDEGIYLEDLNSTNGTLVNKKPIEKQLLQHGDEIGLGKYSLKYLKDATVSPIQPSGFENTVLVTPQTAAPEDDGVPEAVEPLVEEGPLVEEQGDAIGVEPDVPEPEGESRDGEATHADTGAPEASQLEEPVNSPRLQVLSGDDAGNSLWLDKSMLKIGRPGEQVAVITKRQEGYFITHVAGDNFPLINGEVIGAHAYALSDHDVIDVLDIKMEFRLD